jgi:hypothetical protein
MSSQEEDFREWRKSLAGQIFRPSNGTEGLLFEEQFCWKCSHDGFSKNEDEESCEILLRSLCNQHVPEWIWGVDGNPLCTHFIHVDDIHPPTVHPDQLELL